MAKATIAEVRALVRRCEFYFCHNSSIPSPASKGLTFANELVRRGHIVEVLTGFPNYPGGRLYPGYPLALWRRESCREYLFSGRRSILAMTSPRSDGFELCQLLDIGRNAGHGWHNQARCGLRISSPCHYSAAGYRV